MISNVKSEWVNGNLVFKNKETGATVFTITLNGITSSLETAIIGNLTVNTNKFTVDASNGNAIIGGDLELVTPQYVKGERFTINLFNFAAAQVGQPFFIAPAACKVISAHERHITICDTADTMTIEKIEPGEAPGAGDVVLTAPFTLNSTANTPVNKTAVATAAATLGAGDALCTKFVAGDGTDYASANITLTLEWL